jgi:hypothetical protein
MEVSPEAIHRLEPQAIHRPEPGAGRAILPTPVGALQVNSKRWRDDTAEYQLADIDDGLGGMSAPELLIQARRAALDEQYVSKLGGATPPLTDFSHRCRD